eukprot:CAMPEP_0196579710 /NCGR_PEP_ID=MMETSP1081-20130531/24465_1 /TAXON_ID=36882 /ORGANISM="Pyramimonas amylifera, Strain CCMP720" /LENGTH=1028 /DNA_ID=CAMNT_0041899373 /DNA_START=416 /DNA_END=3502 /DNA_ORIENTATION=+
MASGLVAVQFDKEKQLYGLRESGSQKRWLLGCGHEVVNGKSVGEAYLKLLNDSYETWHVEIVSNSVTQKKEKEKGKEKGKEKEKEKDELDENKEHDKGEWCNEKSILIKDLHIYVNGPKTLEDLKEFARGFKDVKTGENFVSVPTNLHMGLLTMAHVRVSNLNHLVGSLDMENDAGFSARLLTPYMAFPSTSQFNLPYRKEILRLLNIAKVVTNEEKHEGGKAGGVSMKKYDTIVRRLYTEGCLRNELVQCHITEEGEKLRRVATRLCLVHGCLLFDEPASISAMANATLSWTYEDWDLAIKSDEEESLQVLTSRVKWLTDLKATFEHAGSCYKNRIEKGEIPIASNVVSENIHLFFKSIIEKPLTELRKRLTILIGNATKKKFDPSVLFKSSLQVVQSRLAVDRDLTTSALFLHNLHCPTEERAPSKFEALANKMTHKVYAHASNLREPQKKSFETVSNWARADPLLQDREELRRRCDPALRQELDLRLKLCDCFVDLVRNSYEHGLGHHLKSKIALETCKQGLPHLKQCVEVLKAHMEAKYAAGSLSLARQVQHVCQRGDILLQIPTGCGKTGIICLAPFAFGISPCKRVLVVAPNTEIRNELYKNLSGRHESGKVCETASFLVRQKLCSFQDLPRVVSFNMADVQGGSFRREDLQGAEVVVATFQSFTDQERPFDKLQQAFTRTFFDLIIIDEAHHSPAHTISNIRQYFRMASCIMLTATPYRRDELGMAAKIAYTYDMSLAIQQKFIKQVYWDPVPVTKMVVANSCTRSQQVWNSSQILDQSEISGPFRDKVSLVQEDNKCILSVMSWAMQRLCKLRQVSNKKHCAIAQAKDISEAQALAEIWNTHTENVGRNGNRKFLVAWVSGVGGGTPGVTNCQQLNGRKEVLKKLKENMLDIVVHVKLLGEGFDMPLLSVAVFFHGPGSLGPFAQLVGRVVRRLNGSDEDNSCYIISHPGLGLHMFWDAYTKEVQGSVQGPKRKNSHNDEQIQLVSQEVQKSSTPLKFGSIVRNVNVNEFCGKLGNLSLS